MLYFCICFLYFVFVYSTFNFDKRNIYKVREIEYGKGVGEEVLLNCPAHLKPINDKYPLVIFSNTAVAAPPSLAASLAAQRIKRKETNFVRCRRTHDNNSWEPPLPQPLSLPFLCPHSAESESERWRREKKCCQTSQKKITQVY